MSQKEWFASWFDSPYYHLLYQHRDDNEAKQFIGHLIEVLHLPQGAKVLDLACGKGRHSITLAQMGYNVTGADLAANSIASAEQSSAALPFNDLRFLVHDMRQPIPGATFKAVFNLFT
ncbi:MAG: class I SAM-dependent methyltransferase, partial [Flavobacteriales bacterium]